MTSAPRRARVMPRNGPARKTVTERTRMSFSGSTGGVLQAEKRCNRVTARTGPRAALRATVQWTALLTLCHAGHRELGWPGHLGNAFLKRGRAEIPVHHEGVVAAVGGPYRS